jgi:hypothetical protein
VLTSILSWFSHTRRRHCNRVSPPPQSSATTNCLSPPAAEPGLTLQGFPSDGDNTICKAYDYYATSFAIPFYTLLYARLAGVSDPIRAKRFRERAIANLPNVAQLFAPDGGAIPFGRSMTYRFACSAFCAAVAFDELEVG